MLSIFSICYPTIILYIKGAKKFGKIKNLFVCALNERQSSRDTGTILEYTNVTGPNQSGLSWDRPPWTHNTVCIPPGEQFVCIVC